MAINPDDFIFHSDFLYEQKISDTVVTVNATGDIGAGASANYTSAWQTIPEGANGVRGNVQVPGIVYNPTVDSGRFQLPTSLIYDLDYYLTFYAKVEVQSNRWRAVINVGNPYNFTIASPNRTFTFYVSTYLPQ